MTYKTMATERLPTSDEGIEAGRSIAGSSMMGKCLVGPRLSEAGLRLGDLRRRPQVLNMMLHGERSRFRVAGFERFQHFSVAEG